MTVREVIENVENFIITKNGQVLGIRNGRDESFKGIAKDKLMNQEVKGINMIKGVIADVLGVRL